MTKKLKNDKSIIRKAFYIEYGLDGIHRKELPVDYWNASSEPIPQIWVNLPSHKKGINAGLAIPIADLKKEIAGR